MDLFNDLKFWMGTEESLGVYLLCLKKMVESGDLQKSADYGQAPVARPPRLLSMTGDIGVIKIAGPLVNSDSWRNEVYGMTGYPEIREALIAAASDDSVGSIILDVASGGGAVAGVFDTAKLISTIDTKVKPVHTFSDSAIMSAAYLIGASARKITIGQMTEAGSIGVLTIHQEMSKMLKDIGITPTVMRAGKYKALGNPYEPLTDEAKAEIQGQLDQMYKVFVQHVADQRSVSYAVADDKLAQGRVFVGESALKSGLVDSISGFDALATKVQEGIDSKKSTSKYGANSHKGNSMSRQALTEQQIAALAESGSAADAGAGAGAGKDPNELTPEAKALADKAAADKLAADKLAADKKLADEADKPSTDAVVAFLQTQLKEANGQVTTLTMEVRDLKAADEKIKATHEPMRAVAVASVSRLRIALGQSALTTEAAAAMSDEQVLAEHNTLRTSFETKFKAGGLAAVTPAEQSDKKGEVDDPVHRARLKATRHK